jgi:KUP system potassium uptake protein
MPVRPAILLGFSLLISGRRMRRWSSQPGRRANLVLAALGIFGAALFFGDSMITPAISVLSSVGG